MKFLRKSDELKEHLPQRDASADAAVEKTFQLGLNQHILEQITGGSEAVAKQYLPERQELHSQPEENEDPIGDERFTPLPGITHRYPDRVLLKPTHSCAVYCRFCFRREKVGPAQLHLSAEELEAALDYIRQRPQIREVILTGGDPLNLAPAKLKTLLEQLDDIEHLDCLRIHSRIPAAWPQRLDQDFIDSCLQTQKPLYLVIHINSAEEISQANKDAWQSLRRSGIILLSQSVLLKGVNDNEAALEELFRALLRLGVKPYYLHHLDPARGTSHFRVSINEGRRLYAALRGKICGTALPQYVIDIPGGYGKVPMNSDYLREVAPGSFVIRDMHGKEHFYNLDKDLQQT